MSNWGASTTENYGGVSRRSLDLEDYVDIARRHRGWILGPIFAGLVISCITAFLLPNTYVSTAIMRITPAQIPETIVPAQLNQQMADRITQMEQDVLSRANLSEIIKNQGLYKRELDRKPLEDVIEEMRMKDVKISVLAIPGQAQRPASAFTISFAYENRYKAKAVVDAMVARFSDVNLTVQRTQSVVTSDFVKDELTDAKQTLDRLDQELTKFRVENQGRLPEQAQTNVQALNSLQMQRASVDEALNRDAQDKLMLETSLQTLKTQHDAIASPVVPEDPSLGRRSDRMQRLMLKISDAETRLTALKESYKDTYPDVREAQSQLEDLQRERDQLQREETAAAKLVKSNSPGTTRTLADLQGAMENTKAAIRAKELDRQTRAKQLEQINRSIGTFESRLESGPANEQRYAQLTREELMASAKYQELQRKQGVAQASQDVTTRKVGENLEVLDPASLPVSPTAPNRWLIVGIGVGVGILLGVLLAAVKETNDTSLKNLKDVRAYTQLPVLTSIPLLENDMLILRKRRLASLSWSAAVIIGVLAMSTSIYYHFFVQT